MKGSDLLVKCLENEGVERVFGIPGEENLDLMDSLIDSSIEFVLTRHESSAAFMAGMVGRLTGKPGVCLSTLGPGASNLTIGIAEAYLGYYPMVAMSGQVRTDQQYNPRKQYLDLVSMFKPITKEAISVRSAGRIPDLTRRAFDVSSTERPGPVFLELPENVLKEQIDGRPLPSSRVVGLGTDLSDLEQLRSLIGTSQKTVILAGQGVMRAKASDALLDFAAKWNIPVAMTWLGAGAIPCDDPINLGVVGLRKADMMLKAFEQADLVILIGYDLMEFEPAFWDVGAKKQVAYIGAVSCEIGPNFSPDLQILGDVREILNASKRDPQPKTAWATSLRNDLNRWMAALPEDSRPIKPQLIIKAIRDVLGHDDIVVSDVGAHLIWMAQHYPAYAPNTMLLSNGLFPMGVGVPWAIAAKLTSPERKVVASVGDGSFLMTSSEIETAKRLGISFVTIIWNDSEYGLIKLRQERAFGRGIGTKFGNPDFVKYAESLGAEGYRVSSVAELSEVLSSCLKDNSLAVIDVSVDGTENNKLSPG